MKLAYHVFWLAGWRDNSFWMKKLSILTNLCLYIWWILRGCVIVSYWVDWSLKLDLEEDNHSLGMEWTKCDKSKLDTVKASR